MRLKICGWTRKGPRSFVWCWLSGEDWVVCRRQMELRVKSLIFSLCFWMTTHKYTPSTSFIMFKLNKHTGIGCMYTYVRIYVGHMHKYNGQLYVLGMCAWVYVHCYLCTYVCIHECMSAINTLYIASFSRKHLTLSFLNWSFLDVRLQI